MMDYERSGLYISVNTEDFTTAEKKDPKISVLSEQSNQYRSILALLLIMALTKLWSAIFEYINASQEYELYALFYFIFILFLFAYRKQSGYIVQRINNSKK